MEIKIKNRASSEPCLRAMRRFALLRRLRTREVNGEGGPLTQPAAHVQRATGFLDQALHNIQPEAGALLRVLGGEVGLKNLRQKFRRNARAGVAHGEPDQRRGVVEVLHAEQTGLRSILERREVERLLEDFAVNVHLMTFGRTLK